MIHIDIIDCIQKEIDNIVKDKYKNDKCYPIFKVGILYNNEMNQQIILNCTHLDNTFSRVLFPIKENYWKYDNLNDIVETLYNQTM